MARTYQRKTNYRPYAERQFSIRAVHRDPPDLDKLCAAYLRYTLVNYEKQQAAHDNGEPRRAWTGPIEGPLSVVPTGGASTPEAENNSTPASSGELPAVSYIRVAGPGAPTAERSVERQRQQIKHAADQLGIQLDREFSDIGYSGQTMDRPGLQQLLQHVTTGRVGYCIVATWDRLASSPEHRAEIDQILADALVAIVIATDHTGPTSR